MKRIYFTITIIVIIGFLLSFSAPAGNGKLTLNFNHYVGGKLMEFDTVNYANALGQPFFVTKFKYYIGNIRLKEKNGHDYIQSTYYLINEEEPLSKQINWADIPSGEYTGLAFIVGVDSAHNCTGLQSGALDPINAMFWTWNTGYVFLKLEGKSAASASPGKILEYHIGGFREPANSIRTIQLAFGQPLVITAGSNHSMQLKADAGELFKNPYNN